MGWLSNWGDPKAVSFAMGVERLVLMLGIFETVSSFVNNDADVYVTAVGKLPGRRLCL